MNNNNRVIETIPVGQFRLTKVSSDNVAVNDKSTMERKYIAKQ